MKCPVCNTELGFQLPAEDFYYDCSFCNSSLSFQNGKCEVISRGSLPPAQPNSSENQTSLEPENKIPSSRETELSAKAFQSLEPAPTSQSPRDQAEVQKDEQTPLDEAPAERDEVTEVPEIGEEEPNEFVEQGLSEEGLEQEELAEGGLAQDESSFVFQEEEEPAPVKEDFSEVVEFSKDKKIQEKGLYLYRLFLSEINSQALKDKVVSILEDGSLEIDLQEYSSYRDEIIHKGKITLSKLSPVQVYVILHHLMGLPLKIYWEQSHIADS